MLLLGALAAALTLDSALAMDAATLSSPYDGHKVLRVPTGNESSVLQLTELISKLGYDRWTTQSRQNSFIDVQVPKDDVESFTAAVASANSAQQLKAELKTIHEDLGESIRAEAAGIFDGKAVQADDTWFDSYHSFDDHISWLSEMNSAYPDNTELFSSGTSIEGRDLAGIHIFGSSGAGSKPAIIYHSTVHAREWVTTMVNEYIAYTLLTRYGEDDDIKAIVDNYDFYIIPLVNPDGFSYTQTDERLWRKNRQDAPSGSDCMGVDINRNWAHKSWGQAEGADTDPCSEAYKGEEAASAPENKQLAAFIDDLASSDAGAIMYFDFHSYSQLFMTPYGYSCSEETSDADEFLTLGEDFAQAVADTHGTEFEHGPICTTIYVASGSSVDYVYDNSKVKYSFTAELRDTGEYGFVLPPEQIRPASEETWAGVKSILQNIQ